MSEKGNPIISRHDVEGSGCSSNNVGADIIVNNFKEPCLLSERKFSPTINDKSTAVHVDYNVSDLVTVAPIITSNKPILDQDSDLSNSQMAFPVSQQIPQIKVKHSNSPENDSQVSSLSNSISLPGVVHSDVLSSELPNVEEWLKVRSDSLSSLDFDSELKSAEIDMSDLFNLRSTISNSISVSTSLDSHPKTPQEIGLVSMYNTDSIPSSSGLMLNSINFESDGSLSSVSTNGGYDIPKNKINNVNILKKSDNLVQVERGLFEEMLLTDPSKKNFKVKDSIIGDEKGLFEELLMPGVQEWLLTVSSTDKKDLVQGTSDSVPQSPNCISNNLQINNQDEATNKDAFDEYDLIGRNMNTFKLMTPQEIENMPSRSLGFDDGQLKTVEIDNITDLPFDSCENKDLTDLPSGSNNEIDHKLFNILAMDASNDTLDNQNFSQNILESINPETKSEDSVPENFNFNVDTTTIDNSNAVPLLKNNQKIKTEKLNQCDSEKYDSEVNLKSKHHSDKFLGKPVNCILPDIIGKQSISNVKVFTKHGPNNNLNTTTTTTTTTSTGDIDYSSQKNISLPVGAIQLKLLSKVSTKQQLANIAIADKKNSFGIIHASALPQLLIKPISLQSQNLVTLPISQTTNNTSLSKQSERIIFAPQNTTGLAKVDIVVDSQANTTNVSIISSNKEHTVFKINTSDLVRAISSIKEPYLEPLGLKNQHLMEPANAAYKLFNIHSHLSNVKKNQDTSKPQDLEIIYYIREIKEPLARTRLTIPNFDHISPIEKVAEDGSNSKNSYLTKYECENLKINSVKNEEKCLHKKKVVEEKVKNPGENVGISLLPGAPPTMVSVPSVLDALSGPATSNVDLAKVLASCDLTPKNDNEAKNSPKSSLASDEKTNNALVQLGINPETLSPNIGPKGNKRWLCPITSCIKQFPKLSYLKVHILNHKGIRPYKCSYDNCDWSFYTSYKLKRHLETHLKRRDFVCTEQDCNRRFTTIYNLNTHMTLHKRPKSWICSLAICGKAFHTRRELEAHMKLHTDVKPPYKCSVEGCSKAYFTPNSLASHMRSHHKEEELCCQWTGCGKKFDKPCRLKAHMRVHTGQRPYVCDYEGCSWRFQCASKLSRHQRKHTNDRKYSCPICKKAFLRSEHLKGHLLTHTGVRNFQCPIANCDAKFTAKSSLYVHLKKHKNQRSDIKFHCPVETCDKICDSKFNLRQHLLKNHTPILASDSTHLDYITLLGDKELNEQLLPQSLSPLDVNKTPLPSFIPLSIQNPTIETSTPNLESNSNDKSNSNIAFGAGESNLVVPMLSLASVQLSNEGHTESNIVAVPDGFFSFTDGDSSQTNAELGFPDLPAKDTTPLKGTSKGLVFQGGSAARTDVLGNIILSQRAKRRQQLNMARKIAASNELSKVNFCSDILPSAVGEVLPISSHFQPSLIQDDNMASTLYDDELISRDIMSDPSIDSQSTINLRDLE